jgi:hypothetical protein
MAGRSTVATEITLGQIGDLIFGAEGKAKLKAAGVDTIRGVYELSSPTTQCANILDIRDPDKVPCYICGMPINNTMPVANGLTGECEHILGIAQAIIFLGLYWNKAAAAEKEGALFMPSKQALSLEYAWSHRTCNQVKSDTSFLGFDGVSYIVDTQKLIKYLTDIWYNTRRNSSEFNTLLHTTYNRSVKHFVNARLGPLTAKFQDICNYLNEYKSPSLIVLAGVAAVMEGPIHPRAREILSGVNLRNITPLDLLADVAERKEGADITVQKIANQVTDMFVESVRDNFRPYINEILRINGNNYSNLILYAPRNIDSLAAPYIKLSILTKLIKQLESTPSRSIGLQLKKIRDDRITKLRAEIGGAEPIGILNGIAASVGLPPIDLVGGNRRKSIKRRHRKSKTRKHKRN